MAKRIITWLYERYVKFAPKQLSDKPISERPFVGMWSDRDDMADSTEWVMKQRKELWED